MPRSLRIAKKGLFVEPLLLPLGLEALDDVTDLSRAHRFLQGHEEVGGTQIAIVFRDLVLKNQVVPERVPRQVRDQTVVLMPIIPVVGENQVGTALSFQRLEIVLDLGAEEREETIAVLLNLDLLSSCAPEKGVALSRASQALSSFELKTIQLTTTLSNRSRRARIVPPQPISMSSLCAPRQSTRNTVSAGLHRLRLSITVRHAL